MGKTERTEDKSFPYFVNILILHECLFEVVLNIHVFMLGRKKEMMQKIVIQSGRQWYIL